MFRTRLPRSTRERRSSIEKNKRLPEETYENYLLTKEEIASSTRDASARAIPVCQWVKRSARAIDRASHVAAEHDRLRLIVRRESAHFQPCHLDVGPRGGSRRRRRRRRIVPRWYRRRAASRLEMIRGRGSRRSQRTTRAASGRDEHETGLRSDEDPRADRAAVRSTVHGGATPDEQIRKYDSRDRVASRRSPRTIEPRAARPIVTRRHHERSRSSARSDDGTPADPLLFLLPSSLLLYEKLKFYAFKIKKKIFFCS